MILCNSSHSSGVPKIVTLHQQRSDKKQRRRNSLLSTVTHSPPKPDRPSRPPPGDITVIVQCHSARLPIRHRCCDVIESRPHPRSRPRRTTLDRGSHTITRCRLRLGALTHPAPALCRSASRAPTAPDPTSVPNTSPQPLRPPPAHRARLTTSSLQAGHSRAVPSPLYHQQSPPDQPDPPPPSYFTLFPPIQLSSENQEPNQL